MYYFNSVAQESGRQCHRKTPSIEGKLDGLPPQEEEEQQQKECKPNGFYSRGVKKGVVWVGIVFMAAQSKASDTVQYL